MWKHEQYKQQQIVSVSSFIGDLIGLICVIALLLGGLWLAPKVDNTIIAFKNGETYVASR